MFVQDCSITKHSSGSSQAIVKYLAQAARCSTNLAHWISLLLRVGHCQLQCCRHIVLRVAAERALQQHPGFPPYENMNEPPPQSLRTMCAWDVRQTARLHKQSTVWRFQPLDSILYCRSGVHVLAQSSSQHLTESLSHSGQIDTRDTPKTPQKTRNSK